MATWLAFLAFCGLVYKRTKASHDIYDKPDNSLPRSIPVRPSKDDQVPMLHMQTTLQTLGLQMKDFTAWLETYNAKGKSKKKAQETCFDMSLKGLLSIPPPPKKVVKATK